jgi:hypothetical protein
MVMKNAIPVLDVVGTPVNPGSSFLRRWPTLLRTVIGAVVALYLPMAVAGLPEPGARIYGTVALDGVLVTAANTAVVIEARNSPTGPAIASYQMGSSPVAGNFYSLLLSAEGSAPLSNPKAVLFGSTVYLVVRDDSGVRDQKTLIISQRGLASRINFGSVDTDGDGLSDEFELANFGSITGGDPNADPDRDGRSNLQEFLQGTNPKVADGRHPADIAPADDRITLSELTDYILAWKTGGTWPIGPALNSTNIEDYITRAGALWKGGEVYVFDNDPATNAPMWWVNVPISKTNAKRPKLASIDPPLQVARTLPFSYRPNQIVPVSVSVTPDSQTKAYAVVETPPDGWTIRNISHDGRWDATNRKIKWGPFFDQTVRRFTYEAVPSPTSGGAVEFTGRGSFDGYGVPADGPLKVWPPGQIPASVLSIRPSLSGGVWIELRGESGRTYQLESSGDLAAWVPESSVTLDANGRASVTAGSASVMRFFRLRLLD